MFIKIVGANIFKPDRINSFHHGMYHGRLSREGSRNILLHEHSYTEKLSVPIKFSCNAYNPPDVARPCLNLIVSKPVLESVKDLPGIRFATVDPGKIIYYPYSAGDYSCFESPAYYRNPRMFLYDNLFDHVPHRPDLIKSVFPRFEIVCASPDEIISNYPEAVTVQLPDPRGTFEPTPTKISEKMVSELSILVVDWGMVFSPEAFVKIDKFLDPDYYAIEEIEI